MGVGPNFCPRCLQALSRWGCHPLVESAMPGWGPTWECLAPKDPPPPRPVAWEFPWPQPRSHYDTDGPAQTTIVHLPGADYTVEPTGDDGAHTGRGRFRVECLSCGEELHGNTTAASSRIRAHHRDHHTPTAEKA